MSADPLGRIIHISSKDTNGGLVRLVLREHEHGFSRTLLHRDIDQLTLKWQTMSHKQWLKGEEV